MEGRQFLMFFLNSRSSFSATTQIQEPAALYTLQLSQMSWMSSSSSSAVLYFELASFFLTVPKSIGVLTQSVQSVSPSPFQSTGCRNSAESLESMSFWRMMLTFLSSSLPSPVLEVSRRLDFIELKSRAVQMQLKMLTTNKKDKYQILGLIGEGAFGQVFKGRKRGSCQVVALKTIRKKGKSEKDLQNIRQQIDILRKLRHENVILLIDSFETSSQFVMVTELGHAELYSLIEDDKSLSEAEVRKVARQIVFALHYLHSNRIAHRDMKPQNILISSNSVVKLCDFGFARSMSYKTQVLTSLKGTPLYMAPQVLQERDYDHTADLWSLGIILYELFAGQPPFMSNHIYSLVEHIVNDPIKYPESMSPDLKSFLRGLLSKDPKERVTWPELLHHPFVREAESELQQRVARSAEYNVWAEAITGSHKDDRLMQVTLTQGLLQQHSLSPKRDKKVVVEDVWNKFLSMAQEERTAMLLRSDAKFLEKLMALLSTNMTDLLRQKSKRNTFICGLKTFSFVVIRSKKPESASKDILKDSKVAAQLIAILKSLIKIENGKNFVDILVELVKAIGLIAKNSFQSNSGLELIYLRSLVPCLTTLAKISSSGEGHQQLALNFVRCAGIVATCASSNFVKSYSFYHEVVENKFFQETLSLLKKYESQQLRKCVVQLLTVIVHPVFGDVATFPWKRQGSSIVQEFNQIQPLLERVSQTIANLLMEFDWAGTLYKLYLSEDETPFQTRSNILRVLLQLSRASKQFSERLLHEKFMVKILLQNLRQDNAVLFSMSAILLCNVFWQVQDKELLQELGGLAVSLEGRFLKEKSPLIQVYSLAFLQQYNFEYYLKQDLAGFLSVLNDLLTAKKVNRTEEVSRVEGSGYGVLPYGFNDWIMTFLTKLLSRGEAKVGRLAAELARSLTQTGLEESLHKVILELDSRNDLSPRGMVAYLTVCHQLCALQLPSFAKRLFRGTALVNFISLFSETQIASIQEWPADLYGGGAACLHLITASLLKILNFGLNSQEEAAIYYEHDIVRLVIGASKYLQRQQACLLVSLLTRLLSLSDETRPFADQFVNENGCMLFARFELLESCSPVVTLVESLSLLATLARLSGTYYVAIDSLAIMEQLRELLANGEPTVRAKACNLVGNLSKHSAYFYEQLKRASICRQVISCCADPDSSVRKFACFALGNMGFHSSALYEELRHSVKVLANLLTDGEEKTRLNAAGALGNLVRNSTLMTGEVLRSEALGRLKHIIETDRSWNVIKAAYYCLNNISNQDDAIRPLMELGLEESIRRHSQAFQRQNPAVKCLQRLSQKLQPN